MREYFSHDYNAREDEKIIDLMAELGWAGYGLYWGLIELLYKNNGKMRTQYERIAFALNSHPDSIKNVVENFSLFQLKNDFFTCKSVNKRLKLRNDKSESARSAAHERWKKRDANAMQPQCDSNAKKESKESKEKKEINIPAFDVFKAYAIENKPKVDIDAVELKYKAWIEAGWIDGNDKPIKNWKSKLLNTLPHLKEKVSTGMPKWMDHKITPNG